VVQRVPAGLRPRRMWTHGYFEARIEEECQRAAESGVPFAVVRLRVEGATPSAVQESLAGELGPGDCAAAYAPREYEAILVGAAPDKARTRARRLVELLEDGGATVHAGVACHPADGRDPDALLARAGAALRGDDSGAPQPTSPVIEDPAMESLYRLI